MTVPNTLPIPIQHQAINSGIPNNATAEKEILSPCLSDNLTMIITTPSSITERPLLSPVDAAGNPKRVWYKQLKPPYAMLVISCMQVGLYVFLDDMTYTRATHALLFDPRRQRELWRFVTYMLLHKDFVHLLQNVLLQCLFGVYLETFEGSRRVLFVYFGGGIGGALGAAVMRGDLIVGASAGVYALLLSYVSHIILNFTTMKYRFHIIVAVGVIIVSDIVYCTFHYFYNASPTISGGAHLFGALHGLLIGLIIFAQTQYYSITYQKVTSIAAFILLLVVFIGLIIADVKITKNYLQTKLKRDFMPE